MMWLDFKIFGSGNGLGAPYCNQIFYWLRNSLKESDRGTFYTWCGWSGSQLQSFQWTHPNAGERRFLHGYEFRPFSSRRTFCRVQVAWKCDALKTNEDIYTFRNKLNEQA